LGELRTVIAKIESDVLHIPEELREILGPDTKMIVGTAAVICFSAAASYEDVLRSIEMIQEDVQLRMAREKAGASRRGKK
jgi:hypothetical protein